MSLYAPVSPWHLLKKMKSAWGEAFLGSYFLVLAHDIVKYAKEWETLLPLNSVVIIDNSVIELGSAVSHTLLKEAHDILGDRVHRILVLPDTFDNPTQTYNDSRRCLYKLLESGLLQGLDTEFMYMVQLSRREDITYALNMWKEYDFEFHNRVRWIGIPRRIADNLGSRMETLLHTRILQLQEPGLSIHLFGFSNNIADDMQCVREAGVYGIDSAVPLRLGQRGELIDFEFVGDQAGPRSADGNPFWENQDASLLSETSTNLILTRRAVRSRR